MCCVFKQFPPFYNKSLLSSLAWHTSAEGCCSPRGGQNEAGQGRKGEEEVEGAPAADERAYVIAITRCPCSGDAIWRAGVSVTRVALAIIAGNFQRSSSASITLLRGEKKTGFRRRRSKVEAARREKYQRFEIRRPVHTSVPPLSSFLPRTDPLPSPSL